MTISERIDKFHSRLNNNDFYIYNFILQNKTLCENISITALSAQCHISKSTILRFCQRLGLKGFSEFKTLLKLENNERDSSCANCVKDAYSGYQTYLNKLLKKDFSSIVRRIENAHNLYVLGSGDFQDNAALELKRSFLQVNKIFFQIASNQEYEAFENIIQQDDVVIIISYSGENQKVLEFAKVLKIKKVTIISITIHQSNSLAKLSDEQLYLDSIDIQNPLGPRYEGLVNYFMLIDFLVLNYIHFHKEETNHG